MAETFILGVTSGIVACALWDGLKAIMRRLR